MPTYEYRCKSCGKQTEIFHSMTEPARRKCPACGKNALERLIGTGGAVIFKGSGFYQTDYRSDSYKKGAAAAEKSAKPATPDKDGAGKKTGGGDGPASTGTGAKPAEKSAT